MQLDRSAGLIFNLLQNHSFMHSELFMRQVFRTLILTLLLTTTLFFIRWITPEWINRHFWGADGWFMASLVEQDPFPLYYRSLLTLWIHKSFFLLFHPLGISGWNAIALSSSLGGAIAIQALWRMNPDWIFLSLNVFCGSFLVFVGHAENYAWVNTFLLLSWLSAWRWIKGSSPAWPTFTFFVLACLSHMLALFYIPAYVYLLWRYRRFDPKEIVLPLVVVSLLMAVLSACFQMLGTDVGFERLVPWGHVWAKNQFFTFLSPKHLDMLFYFHWRAAWLGIPLEIPLLLFLLRRIDTLFLRFMLGCTGCGLIWTTLWHPDWGPLDWDLFSQFGIPLHLLLGLLIRPSWRTYKESES